MQRIQTWDNTHDGANGEIIPSLDLEDPTNSSSTQD